MSNTIDPILTARSACLRVLAALAAAAIASAVAAQVPPAAGACARPEAGGCPDARVVVESGAARTELRVTSLRALRDAGVVKQGRDYSCGSAALATLLTYGLNDPVDEGAL